MAGKGRVYTLAVVREGGRGGVQVAGISGMGPGPHRDLLDVPLHMHRVHRLVPLLWGAGISDGRKVASRSPYDARRQG